jgi:hypothetical protein
MNSEGARQKIVVSALGPTGVGSSPTGTTSDQSKVQSGRTYKEPDPVGPPWTHHLRPSRTSKRQNTRSVQMRRQALGTEPAD